VKNCEKQVLEQLQYLANNQLEPTFLEKLKELGLNTE